MFKSRHPTLDAKNSHFYQQIEVPKPKGELLKCSLLTTGTDAPIPGYFVSSIDPKGPCSGKLKVGDIVLSINQTMLTGRPHEDVGRICKKAIPRSGATFVIIRANLCHDHAFKFDKADAKKRKAALSPADRKKMELNEGADFCIGLNLRKGIIRSVLKGSVAEKAGLKRGYRVIEVNGHPVNDSSVGVVRHIHVDGRNNILRVIPTVYAATGLWAQYPGRDYDVDIRDINNIERVRVDRTSLKQTIGITIYPTSRKSIVPGAYISNIAKGSPAEGKLHRGDYIFAVQHSDISFMPFDQAMSILEQTVKRDVTIIFHIVRAAWIREMRFKLDKSTKYGMDMQNGALTKIHKGSMAEKLGFRATNMICEINGNFVGEKNKTLEQLKVIEQLLWALGDKEIKFTATALEPCSERQFMSGRLASYVSRPGKGSTSKQVCFNDGIYLVARKHQKSLIAYRDHMHAVDGRSPLLVMDLTNVKHVKVTRLPQCKEQNIPVGKELHSFAVKFNDDTPKLVFGVESEAESQAWVNGLNIYLGGMADSLLTTEEKHTYDCVRSTIWGDLFMCLNRHYKLNGTKFEYGPDIKKKEGTDLSDSAEYVAMKADAKKEKAEEAKSQAAAKFTDAQLELALQMEQAKIDDEEAPPDAPKAVIAGSVSRRGEPSARDYSRQQKEYAAPTPMPASPKSTATKSPTKEPSPAPAASIAPSSSSSSSSRSTVASRAPSAAPSTASSAAPSAAPSSSSKASSVRSTVASRAPSAAPSSASSKASSVAASSVAASSAAPSSVAVSSEPAPIQSYLHLASKQEVAEVKKVIEHAKWKSHTGADIARLNASSHDMCAAPYIPTPANAMKLAGGKRDAPVAGYSYMEFKPKLAATEEETDNFNRDDGKGAVEIEF